MVDLFDITISYPIRFWVNILFPLVSDFRNLTEFLESELWSRANYGHTAILILYTNIHLGKQFTICA